MSTATLTKDNFDQIIQNNDMVVVDFWATWCGPCKAFGEICKALAQKRDDVIFGHVNIEQEPELAADFEVRSVPLVMIFREGVAVFMNAGVLPMAALVDLLEQAKALDMKTVHQQIADESD